MGVGVGGGWGWGGQDKPPWTAYPPPMYQLVSSFPTLKTSLQGLSCEYKANTFIYEGCSSDGEEKNINIKNLGGGQFKPP